MSATSAKVRKRRAVTGRIPSEMPRIGGSSESTHRIYLGLFAASSRSPKCEILSVTPIDDNIPQNGEPTIEGLSRRDCLSDADGAHI